MDEIKITERGWQGHFICQCRYHRNTLIEYQDKKIVVSTVGNYVYQDKIETIGLNRYYETMVFWAKFDDPYFDIDVNEGITFDSNWAIDKVDEKSDYYAEIMHNDVVKEISQKIKDLKEEV